MKKVLLIALFAGLMAGTANAATLYMQFAGGGSEVTLSPSQTVAVEIRIKGYRIADDLGGVLLSNQLAPGLAQTGVIPAPAGWNSASNNGIVGGQVGGVYTDVNLAGPRIVVASVSDVLLATQILHQNDITGRFELAFAVDVAFPRPTLSKFSDGSNWTIVVGVTGTNPIAGQFTIGAGSPGYQIGYDINPRNPLIVNCIPEPASLALLALGMVAGLRRRS